jgi:mRNA interferase MazF
VEVRGEIVTVVLPGAYGKPRPALVVQSDLFEAHPSVSVLPITSELRDTPLFRVRITPDADNGLQNISEIMVDKATTIPREKIGVLIGVADYATMQEVNRCLAVFLGIA